MIVQAINNTNGTLTYSNESVTIPANSTVTLNNSIVVPFSFDSSVNSDIVSGNLSLSDSVTVYSGAAATAFLNNAANFLGHFDKSGSGTITSLNGTVVSNVSGSSSVSFSITGTWVATVQFQAQTGDGNWSVVTGFFQPGGAAGQSTATNAFFTIPCGGYTQVQMVATAFTSGTISVSWSAGVGTNAVQAVSLKAASFQVTNTQVDGGKATYSASVTQTPGSAATDVLTISGSSSKTIRVVAIRVTMGSTTASTQNVFLIKRSATNTGGTSSSLTAVPHDSSDAAATASVLAYTANPTGLGTAVGNVRIERIEWTSSGGNVAPAAEWSFGVKPGAKAIVLRGTSQLLAVNLGGTIGTSPTIQISIEWTEE